MPGGLREESFLRSITIWTFSSREKARAKWAKRSG
jgi:hypothetical protein